MVRYCEKLLNVHWDENLVKQKFLKAAEIIDVVAGGHFHNGLLNYFLLDWYFCYSIHTNSNFKTYIGRLKIMYGCQIDYLT